MISRRDIDAMTAKKTHLTAASEIISVENIASPKAIRGKRARWQQEVLAYTDVIPEVENASLWMRNTVNRVSFTSDNATINQELQKLDVGRVAQLIGLVGEAFVAFNNEWPDLWNVLAPGEIEVKDGKVKIKTEDGKMVAAPSGTDVIRIFIPDESDRYKAKSTLKPMLDILEALYLHQIADVTLGGSRAAWAGFVYIPNDELDQMPPGWRGEPDQGTQEYLAGDIQRFLRDSIGQHSSHGDRRKVMMPYLLFGAADNADGLKHVIPERSDNAAGFNDRIAGYIKRIARTLPVPSEVTLGYEGANDWSAYKMSEDGYQFYTEPMVNMIVEALNRFYVQRGASGDVVEADPSKLISKPDLTDAAIRLFQLGALSMEATLRATGFDPETDAGDGVVRTRSPNEQGQNQHAGTSRYGMEPRTGTGDVV